jgi:hypothetical protein
MLTFNLYTADDSERSHGVVHINPIAVIAVEETERRHLGRVGAAAFLGVVW